MARTTTVRLLTADYADRLDEAYRRAYDIEQRIEKESKKPQPPRRTGERSALSLLEDEYARLREEYEALKAEAEREAKAVTLKAIGRKEWRALKANHPPRTVPADPEVVKQDRLAGVNVETVEDDLVHASLIAPEFKSRAAFDEWVDELSEAEFQTVLAHAWSLANTVRVDPKSLPALLTPNGAPSDG